MENITLSQLAILITTIGVICGFLFKVFSVFNQVKENQKQIQNLEVAIQDVKDKNEKQKEEIFNKVDQTNIAVNLLCSAISAMIDNQLNENKNLDELRIIKQKLDEKKEIV